MATHADDSVFASDHDREVVCNQLAIATGEGRLTPDEHEEWVGRALASRKRGELRRLIEKLPNPALPDLPPRKPITGLEKDTEKLHNAVIRKRTADSEGLIIAGFFLIFIIIVIPGTLWLIMKSGNNVADTNYPTTSASASPTPTATVTDPQDRAFVQLMLDYHNDCRYNYGNCNNPTNIDQSAVLDIAHRLHNPASDIRQQFLLIMDSNAYKGLTNQEKYRAGKTALSIWRPDGEAAWVQLGKDQGYE